MKLRELQCLLSNVESFEYPQFQLEQVSTSAEIASHMLFVAESEFGDISDSFVGDFGCGPGMLSIAASAMGADCVVGFDVDPAALNSCSENLAKLEIENVDVFCNDIRFCSFANDFDTVVMNPPFGTRVAGIDTVFVQKALQHAGVVYSLHKSSTREHFLRFAEANHCKVDVVAEIRYDLPKVFKFHKEKNKDIYVDLLRFSHL